MYFKSKGCPLILKKNSLPRNRLQRKRLFLNIVTGRQIPVEHSEKYPNYKSNLAVEPVTDGDPEHLPPFATCV